jgi:hypothetical protein
MVVFSFPSNFFNPTLARFALVPIFAVLFAGENPQIGSKSDK